MPKKKTISTINKELTEMIQCGFAADELTNPKSEKRAITHKEFIVLESRVAALEKKARKAPASSVRRV